MLLLIVFGVVLVFAVVVLGSVAYGVLGARSRLLRELGALQHDVAPVAAELQAALATAASGRQRPSDA